MDIQNRGVVSELTAVAAVAAVAAVIILCRRTAVVVEDDAEFVAKVPLWTCLNGGFSTGNKARRVELCLNFFDGGRQSITECDELDIPINGESVRVRLYSDDERIGDALSDEVEEQADNGDDCVENFDSERVIVVS
jgi:hypothetical protein